MAIKFYSVRVIQTSNAGEEIHQSLRISNENNSYQHLLRDFREKNEETLTRPFKLVYKDRDRSIIKISDSECLLQVFKYHTFVINRPDPNNPLKIHVVHPGPGENSEDYEPAEEVIKPVVIDLDSESDDSFDAIDSNEVEQLIVPETVSTSLISPTFPNLINTTYSDSTSGKVPTLSDARIVFDIFSKTEVFKTQGSSVAQEILSKYEEVANKWEEVQEQMRSVSLSTNDTDKAEVESESASTEVSSNPFEDPIEVPLQPSLSDSIPVPELVELVDDPDDTPLPSSTSPPFNFTLPPTLHDFQPVLDSLLNSNPSISNVLSSIFPSTNNNSSSAANNSTESTEPQVNFNLNTFIRDHQSQIDGFMNNNHGRINLMQVISGAAEGLQQVLNNVRNEADGMREEFERGRDNGDDVGNNSEEIDEPVLEEEAVVEAKVEEEDVEVEEKVEKVEVLTQPITITSTQFIAPTSLSQSYLEMKRQRKEARAERRTAKSMREIERLQKRLSIKEGKFASGAPSVASSIIETEAPVVSALSPSLEVPTLVSPVQPSPAEEPVAQTINFEATPAITSPTLPAFTPSMPGSYHPQYYSSGPSNTYQHHQGAFSSASTSRIPSQGQFQPQPRFKLRSDVTRKQLSDVLQSLGINIDENIIYCMGKVLARSKGKSLEEVVGAVLEEV